MLPESLHSCGQRCWDRAVPAQSAPVDCRSPGLACRWSAPTVRVTLHVYLCKHNSPCDLISTLCALRPACAPPAPERCSRSAVQSSPETYIKSTASGKLTIGAMKDHTCPPHSRSDGRISCRVASVKQELGAGGPWFVQRLSNMSTIMREWGALHAWQGMPFTTTLLACAAGTEGYSRPSSIPAVRPLAGLGLRVQNQGSGSLL